MLYKGGKVQLTDAGQKWFFSQMHKSAFYTSNNGMEKKDDQDLYLKLLNRYSKKKIKGIITVSFDEWSLYKDLTTWWNGGKHTGGFQNTDIQVWLDGEDKDFNQFCIDYRFPPEYLEPIGNKTIKLDIE